MKLSIVIPAYNEENYLGACLESVLKEKNNSKHDVEVIVVNNASSDKTREVAESFPEVIVVDEPKKGLLHARHAGFKTSGGDLIANIDADAILTPGWINTVMDEFGKKENIVALSGPYIYYDLPVATNIGIRIYYYLGYLSYIFNHFVLRVGAMLQGGNFIVRRSALEKIGGYNLNLTFYGEDTDIARRISKIGRVKFTFKLPMYSSGRRLKKEGLITMAVKYPVNYFSTTFFKKPFHDSYIDIRDNQESEHKTTVKQMHVAMGALSLVSALIVLGILSAVAYTEIAPHSTYARSHHFIQIFQDNDN